MQYSVPSPLQADHCILTADTHIFTRLSPTTGLTLSLLDNAWLRLLPPQSGMSKQTVPASNPPDCPTAAKKRKKDPHTHNPSHHTHTDTGAEAHPPSQTLQASAKSTGSARPELKHPIAMRQAARDLSSNAPAQSGQSRCTDSPNTNTK
jgi:hypothetical protein